MYDGIFGRFVEDTAGVIFGSRPLVAFVQKVRHALFEIEDHLAKHAVRPAELVEVVSVKSD